MTARKNANAGTAVEKAVKQSISSPKAALALETGTEDIPGLPSFSELVTIAATMSIKGEDPEITASRAIKLWKACHKALKSETDFEETRRSDDKNQSDFLAACGLDFDDLRKVKRTILSVPLETFLTAASPNSKLPALRKKWLEYWKQVTEDVIEKRGNDRSQTSYGSLKPYPFPSDPEADIDSRAILLCRDSFKKFLENKHIATGQKCGEAGLKARTLYGAVRQLFRNAKELEPEQRTMLVELTPKEINTVTEKCKIQGKEMSPRMVSKLKAAIHALKTPDTGRPRINKSDPAKNF